MSLLRRDLSVLTGLPFLKLVLGMLYRLESVRGYCFFRTYLYFHVVSPDSLRINRFSITFSTSSCFLFFIAWTFLAKSQSSSVCATASAKTPKCLTTVSTSIFFVIWNVSYHAEGQCPLAQGCDSFRYANNTSAHFSISFRHPWALCVSILIEVCPAHVHNPVYILEWDFSFWGLVQVLWTSWGVWPWYFAVIEVLEGLRNIWRRRYGVPIFYPSVPVCTLGESWPWLCISTGWEICIVSPDFNKFVKLMSEPIWHNFIILAICILKVLHSLRVLDLQDNEQL